MLGKLVHIFQMIFDISTAQALSASQEIISGDGTSPNLHQILSKGMNTLERYTLENVTD